MEDGSVSMDTIRETSGFFSISTAIRVGVAYSEWTTSNSVPGLFHGTSTDSRPLVLRFTIRARVLLLSSFNVGSGLQDFIFRWGLSDGTRCSTGSHFRLYGCSRRHRTSTVDG